MGLVTWFREYNGAEVMEYHFQNQVIKDYGFNLGCNSSTLLSLGLTSPWEKAAAMLQDRSYGQVSGLTIAM